MKHKLWIMVGIPGSGKSTWIRDHENFFKPSCGVISRDQIRFSLLHDGDTYFAREKEVWNKYVNEAIISLTLNVNTILDATHLNESSRGKILRALKEHLINVEINAIVIDSGLDTALKQNSYREGIYKVPETAICNMNSSMTIPTFEEGFDRIYIWTKNNNYRILTKEVM